MCFKALVSGTMGANVAGWGAPTLVPSLGPLGLGVLALGLLWTGRRMLAPRA